jgi:hypothetical protein
MALLAEQKKEFLRGAAQFPEVDAKGYALRPSYRLVHT